MSEKLNRTQLFDWHVAHGGRMVPFAGWEMPVQYPTGPIEEHHITRRSAGLFDIDHMGQFNVTGPDAEAYLNLLVTWDVNLMAEFEAHYALMCHENGGVVDDVFIYRLPDRWFVVVNADNRSKDFEWMTGHTTGYDVTVTDVSDETYMVALQGPKAIALLQCLTPTDAEAVSRFHAVETTVAGVPALIGRTGYTGEDGVEIFFPATYAVQVWEAILNTGPEVGIEVAPIGLAARDSLRFEPAFSLYGHEITDDITPLEARLGWACRFDKPFIGREALLKQKTDGLPRKLVSFELVDRGVPRAGYTITNTAGEEVGTVATGLFAPTVEKYCGSAFVQPQYAKLGTELNVLIRNKSKAAKVVKRTFYKPAYK